jgi:hypothetical protein
VKQIDRLNEVSRPRRARFSQQNLLHHPASRMGSAVIPAPSYLAIQSHSPSGKPEGV